MTNKFYLDDYNVISSEISQEFLNSNLKLFKNNNEINYSLKSIDNMLYLYFDDEYKEFDKYEVSINNQKCNVENRFITHTKRFEEEYKVDVNTLGAIYQKDKTIFRLWAPLNLEAYVIIDNHKLKMNYLNNGLFELSLNGDYLNYKYHYEVVRDGTTYIFKDLFAYKNKDNESIIVDINNYHFNNIKTEIINDPIIYELNIRDFSSDENVNFKYKSKFKAFLEEGLTLNNEEVGIDYLKKLKVSHLQIMPVLNFDLDKGNYNWGYNPIDYNSFYEGYVQDDSILEFRQLVDKIHSINKKVVLDVIYNHVYKLEESSFNKILPYYFFRYYKDGNIGNGSYCGNELRSESYFLREYFNLINKRLIQIYDIDGLRFDLMGILDIDSINYFYSECSKLKKDFLIYGEGWNMSDILPSNIKANILNADKLNNIKLFNDLFRNSLKGEDNNLRKGYLLNNKEYELDFINAITCNYLKEEQSINYTECHDNYTVYDKLSLFNLNEEDKRRICKLALGLTVLLKGTPFIHMGQEFLRTKKGISNSYNANDDINKIDWTYVSKNKDIVNYFNSLIEYRNKLKGEFSLSYFYGIPVITIGNYEIVINNTEYDYNYNSWITFKNIDDLTSDTRHNLKEVIVPKYTLILLEK